MARHWKLVDVNQTQIRYVGSDDKIIFAREYIAGKKYDASEANQLISNLKKTVSRKDKADWTYKKLAIDKFAEELSWLLKDDTEYVFAAIPSSICKNDPQYDSRIDDTLSQLKRIKSDVVIEEPIVTAATTLPSHLGGSRDPDVLYQNMHWQDMISTTSQIILVDDVITTGAHFAACKRMIQENHPQMEIIGVFWAKTIWD